jgi:pseudouridine kinase
MAELTGTRPPKADVACLGGLALDRRGHALAPVVPRSSNPVAMTSGVGGVAANVARAIAALGRKATLATRVGADWPRVANDALVDLAAPLLIADDSRRTASYTTLIEPDGRLYVGIADMEVHERWNHADIDRALAHVAAAGVWFLDANLPDFAVARLATMAGSERVLAANGVSAAKAVRLARVLHRVNVLFANAEEASVLGLDPRAPSRGADQVTVVTHGAEGLIAVVGDCQLAVPAPPLPGPAVDETGAGDCLIAGTLAARLAGWEWAQALKLGLAAAAAAMASADSVPGDALAALARARLA